MNDETFDSQIKRIRELEQETLRLEQEAQDIMNALGITREEIDALFSNPANFTEEEKKFVEEQKANFEMTFQMRAERVRTAASLKKKYEDLHLSRHWIPVR